MILIPSVKSHLKAGSLSKKFIIASLKSFDSQLMYATQFFIMVTGPVWWFIKNSAISVSAIYRKTVIGPGNFVMPVLN